MTSMATANGKIEYLGQEIDIDWIRQCYSKIAQGEMLESLVQKQIEKDKRYIERVHRKFVVNSGWKLTFYKREHEVFPKAYEVKVDDRKARQIVTNLLHHFHKLKIAPAHLFFVEDGEVAV